MVYQTIAMQYCIYMYLKKTCFCRETEVTVKKTNLSAEAHDQPKQLKQGKKKKQPPIIK